MFVSFNEAGISKHIPDHRRQVPIGFHLRAVQVLLQRYAKFGVEAQAAPVPFLGGEIDADAEIEFLISRELRKLGKSETRVNPDMLVAYALGVDMAMMKFKEDPENKVSVLENVPEGALVVALMDSKTEIVTWAAVAVGEIQGNDQKIAKLRLNYVVTEMFKQLPK